MAYKMWDLTPKGRKVALVKTIRGSKLVKVKGVFSRKEAIKYQKQLEQEDKNLFDVMREERKRGFG